MARSPFRFWQLAALMACGTPMAQLEPDAGTADAGSTLTCSAGSHAQPDAGCDTTLSWLKGPSATTGVNHHATLIAGSQLFVMGGVSGPAGATVQSAITSAAIGDDGLLADWKDAGTLPRPLAGFTFAQRDTHVFVVSGITTNGGSLARARTTSLGALQPDGTWGQWTAGPQLPSARFHASQATVGDFTYVLGGIGESGEVTGTVFRSRYTGDTASAWDTLSPLPDVRSHETAIVVGRRIYVVSGLRVDTTDPADLYTDALAADVSDDGSLSAWRTVSTSPLPLATTTAGGFEKDGFLYLVGGLQTENGMLKLTAAVQRAPLLDGGMLGAWEQLPPLPRARGHVHQTPLFKNQFVYSVCGTSDLNHDSITDVFIGLFQ